MMDPCVDDVVVFDRCHFSAVPVGKQARDGVGVADHRFQRTKHMTVDVEQMRAKVEKKSSACRFAAVTPACHAAGCESVPAIVLDARVKGCADVACGNATTKFANAVVVAEGESDLVDFTAVICGFEHGRGFRVVDREGLFAEHMFAMIESHDGLIGMRAIGTGDCDRIDIWIGAQGFDVVGRMFDPKLFGEFFCSVGISSADGDDLGLRMGEDAGNVANFREIAGADDGYPEFVMGIH